MELLKVPKVRVDVEGEPVEGYPMIDRDADRGYLPSAVDPDSRSAAHVPCDDPEWCHGTDHHFLYVLDEATHVPRSGIEVDDRVPDELARPMVGGLTPPLHLDDR